MQKILKIEKQNYPFYMDYSKQYKSRWDISNDIEQPEVLQNQLISLQSYWPNKSLTDWAGELKNSIEEVHYQPCKSKFSAHIAEIFDNAIRIFMALENYIYARELAYSQIQLFTNWSKKIGVTDLLKYVFNPWMQLIRINRLEGNIYDAFEKLNALNLAESKIVMGENKFLTQSLYQSLQQDFIMLNEVQTQSVLERIKLCFESRQYAKLITYIEDRLTYFIDVPEIIIQEAKIIAYANVGKIHDALKIIMKNKSHPHRGKDMIFTLREYELQLAAGLSPYRSNTLDLIEEWACQLVKTPSLTINNIIFILQAVRVMKMAGEAEKCMPLIYSCLEAEIVKNDEVLKADCLICLYDLALDADKKKMVEDLMITHYFNTQYVSARKKMLHAFKDLKYVENKYNHDNMTSLFEDLLAFNI